MYIYIYIYTCALMIHLSLTILTNSTNIVNDMFISNIILYDRNNIT